MAQPTLKDILDTLLADPSQDLLLNSMKTAIDEAQSQGKTETPYDLNFGQADARLTVQGNGWHAVAELVNRYLAHRGWWFHQIEEARSVPPISRGFLKQIPEQQVSAPTFAPEQQQPEAGMNEQIQQVEEDDSQTEQLSSALQNVAIEDGKKTGVCKWYNLKKGFGFITPDDEALSDVFVHRSEIHSRQGMSKSLDEGENVEFYIRYDDTGRAKAVDVAGPDGDYVQGRRRRRPPKTAESFQQDHSLMGESNHSEYKSNHLQQDYTSSQSSRPNGNGVAASTNSGKRSHDPTVVVTGKCKWYNVQKGFGFVTPDDGTPDIFVHRSEVNSNSTFKSLGEGEPVEFFVRIDEQGRPKAVSVTGPKGSFVVGARRRASRRRNPPRPSFNKNGYQNNSEYDDISVDHRDDDDDDQHDVENGDRILEEKTKERKHHNTLDISQIDPKTQKTGVCKWFNRKKGFGFITIDNTDMDVFVNRADIHSDSYFKTLAEGEKLEFYVGVDDEDRPKAIEVTGPEGTSVKGFRPSQSRRSRR